MRKTILIVLLLVLVTGGAYSEETLQKEVSAEQAIKTALKAAVSQDFNVNEADIEILKVKKGLERGPMRMVWLVRTFPKPMSDKILDKEFWVIYLYPKGTMEGTTSILGGDFTAIVDLYEGSVLDTWAGM